MVRSSGPCLDTGPISGRGGLGSSWRDGEMIAVEDNYLILVVLPVSSLSSLSFSLHSNQTSISWQSRTSSTIPNTPLRSIAYSSASLTAKHNSHLSTHTNQTLSKNGRQAELHPRVHQRPPPQLRPFVRGPDGPEAQQRPRQHGPPPEPARPEASGWFFWEHVAQVSFLPTFLPSPTTSSLPYTRTHAFMKLTWLI